MRAATWEATDWATIADLSGRLHALMATPVVALNRAMAVSLAEGPAAGLALLDALEGPALAGYHRLPAARGDCLRRLGRWPAAAAYRRALRLTQNLREQAFFAARVAECETALPD